MYAAANPTNKDTMRISVQVHIERKYNVIVNSYLSHPEYIP